MIWLCNFFLHFLPINQLSMTPTPVSPEVQVFGLSVRLSVLVAVLQFLPATLGTCLITWVFRAKARELSIVCQAS